MNGKTTTISKSASTNPASSIIIRRAKLSDAYKIGRNAAKTYLDTPLTSFFSPKAREYYTDYERGYQHRAMARMLDPRNVTIVACKASSPETVVGHAQSIRLGEDEGAKRQIRSRESVLLLALSWLFWAWVKLVDFVTRADKSADPQALKLFEEAWKADHELHWTKKERKCRWHTQSVLVLAEYQGMGIGKRLMKEVTGWAQAENVVVGLEASEQGEQLYYRAGFKLLGRFKNNLLVHTKQASSSKSDPGGVMMWTPEGWKESEE